jgi:hypothetical protein
VHARLHAAALALLVAAPAAAQTFDGTVAYRVAAADGTRAEMLVMTKGTKVRNESNVLGAGGVRSMIQLTDYGTGNVVTLLPQRHVYVKSSLKTIRGERPAVATPTKGASDIVDTGRRETIAGHSCAVYSSRREALEACIATGLGHFLPFEGESGIGGAAGGGVPGSPALARLLRTFPNGAMVLRVRHGGQQPVELVATRVERGDLPDNLFAVPAGFAEVTAGRRR